MKKIWILITAILLVVSIALGISCKMIWEKYESQTKRIDELFRGNLLLLSENLYEYDKENEFHEWNCENIRYANMCMTLFPLSSYADNQELSTIVSELNLLSKKGKLSSKIDVSLAEDMAYMCMNIEYEELIHGVYEQLCE